MQKMKWVFSLVFALGGIGLASASAQGAVQYGTPAAAAALQFDPFTLKTASSSGPVVPVLVSKAAAVQAPSVVQVLATEPAPQGITVSVANAPHVFEAPYLKGLKSAFVVSLSKTSNRTITVRYATANGSARAGVDYQATSGTLTFKPGETNKIVNVNILNDNIPNQADPKTFFLNLSRPSGATIARSRGVSEIFERTDQEQRQLTLVVSNAPALFEVGNNLSAQFTISLSRKSTRPVTVRYATANGTAKAGSDFRSTSGTLTFQPGQTLKTVSVRVFDNTGGSELNAEEFYLTISNPKGAVIARNRGIALIVENKKL